MVSLIDSIRNETEPDWDSMKPEKEHVSFDPDIRSIRKETMEVRLVGEQLEDNSKELLVLQPLGVRRKRW